MKEKMKTTQSEIEIQEQLMEVVERNTGIGEQRAVQEEEDSALVTAELLYATEHYNSERERTKLLEEEERESRDAIADAQQRERHLAKEGILFNFCDLISRAQFFCFLFCHTHSLTPPSLPPIPIVGGGLGSKHMKQMRKELREELDALEEQKEEALRNLSKMRANKRQLEHEVDALKVTHNLTRTHSHSLALTCAHSHSHNLTLSMMITDFGSIF